jgi:hypothetical protein
MNKKLQKAELDSALVKALVEEPHKSYRRLAHEFGISINYLTAVVQKNCDKHGRFEWRPRQLKVKILPYDQVDFGKILEALEGVGSVKRYSVNGRDYGYIPSWQKHQYISPKERRVKSNYPTPPGVQDDDENESAEPQDDSGDAAVPAQTGTGAVPEPAQAVRNGKGMGMERNGKENVGNGNAVVSTGIRNPIPSSMHSSLEQSNPIQSHSQSKPPSTRPRFGSLDEQLDELDELDVHPPAKSSTNKVGAAALRLAKQLYDVLPSSARAQAPKKWQLLWAEDFAGLLNVQEEDAIADIIKDLPHSGKAKYVVRGQTFVEMFEDIEKGVTKFRKAVRDGRIKPEYVPSADDEAFAAELED